MDALFYNENAGYLDALLRGYKSGILTANQYNNLTACHSLDDLKLQLSSTDYGNFLANEPSPVSTSTIASLAREKLVKELNYIKAQAVAPLSDFLDYISYGYMIDNVILLITGKARNSSWFIRNIA